jgi:hypothetical protein
MQDTFTKQDIIEILEGASWEATIPQLIEALQQFTTGTTLNPEKIGDMVERLEENEDDREGMQECGDDDDDDDDDEKTYDDTAAGAIEALKEMSSHNLEGATAQADPEVKGVWLVLLPNDPCYTKAIVYLKGYDEAFGGIREFNDFESEWLD